MESESRRQGGDDELVAEQEELAAAEAGAIGGRRDEGVDPAMEPVLEHGGGVAEGFEQAEEQLRAQAEHDDPGHNPRYDRGEPEQPDGAVHGEADHVESTELEDDVGPGPEE